MLFLALQFKAASIFGIVSVPVHGCQSEDKISQAFGSVLPEAFSLLGHQSEGCVGMAGGMALQGHEIKVPKNVVFQQTKNYNCLTDNDPSPLSDDFSVSRSEHVKTLFSKLSFSKNLLNLTLAKTFFLTFLAASRPASRIQQLIRQFAN